MALIRIKILQGQTTGKDAHTHVQQWFSEHTVIGSFFFFCNIRIFENKCRGHTQKLKTEQEERCDIMQLKM